MFRLIRSVVRIPLRFLRWLTHARGMELLIGLVVAIIGVVLAIRLIKDVLGTIGRWLGIQTSRAKHTTNGIGTHLHHAAAWRPSRLFELLVLLAVLAVALLFIVGRVLHREKERRRDDPIAQLRSHRIVAVVWLVVGTLVGAIPSGLPLALPVAAALSVGICLIGISFAYGTAGAQMGSEPVWRAAIRLGYKRLHWGVQVASGVVVVAVGAIMSLMRWYGGDAGVLIAMVAILVPSWDLGKRGAKESRNWWRRAVQCAGHRDVSRVWVMPDWDDIKQPWSADVLLRLGQEANAVNAAAEQLRTVLGGPESEWTVQADVEHRKLKARLRPAIPSLVMMPTTVEDGSTWELPLGIARGGRGITWDTESDPHLLAVGTTGKGKSIAISTLATGALLRGWQLVICEISKGMLDYLAFRPWCSGWGSTLDGTLTTLDAVYAEVGRRKQLLHQYGAVKVTDLPPAIRVPPILVILDEYYSMIIPEKLKTDEAQELNAVKAQVAGITGKLMREARFVDVHLALGMQRPDATVFAGETKTNVGARLLCGPSDQIARQMALRDADGAPAVRKGCKGRAIIETETEDAAEIQVYLIAAAASPKLPPGTPLVPDVLHAAGVPEAKPLAPPPKPAWTPPPEGVAEEGGRSKATKTRSRKRQAEDTADDAHADFMAGVWSGQARGPQRVVYTGPDAEPSSPPPLPDDL